MLNNSGKKVVIFAMILFILLLMGSVFAAVLVFLSLKGRIEGIFAALGTLVGGAFAAWVYYHMLSALGEAAENSVYTAEQISELHKELKQEQALLDTVKKLLDESTKRGLITEIECMECGTINRHDARFCNKCGAKLLTNKERD